MLDIEQVLSEIHIAFNDFNVYFPCVSSRPKEEYPEYVLTSYGNPSKPMIRITTRGTDFYEQGKRLSTAISKYTGKTYPDQDYICNLYVRRDDRCGNLDGDLYWWSGMDNRRR